MSSSSVLSSTHLPCLILSAVAAPQNATVNMLVGPTVTVNTGFNLTALGAEVPKPGTYRIRCDVAGLVYVPNVVNGGGAPAALVSPPFTPVVNGRYEAVLPNLAAHTRIGVTNSTANPEVINTIEISMVGR